MEKYDKFSGNEGIIITAEELGLGEYGWYSCHANKDMRINVNGCLEKLY